MASWAVLLLLVAVLSLTAAQVYDNCPLITESDLGSVGAPSSTGLVADRLSEGQAGNPMVEIFDFNVVCLAAGTVRGTYRALSVVVFYRCSGNLCTGTESPLGSEGNATSQFEFGCEGSSWESIVETSREASETFTNPSNATLETEASTDCSFCLREDVTTGGFPLGIDGITHCGACDSSCLDPPGLCTDVSDTSCCNVYDSDTCAVSCPAGEAPDANFDCVTQCPELANPANGTVTTTETRLNGSEAIYTCDDGFSLQGDANRICQESGNWSDTAPTCAEIDCGNLANPENGQVTFQDTTFDSEAIYSCNSGYSLDGEERRICQENGVWSDNAPVCKESGGGLDGGGIAGIVIGVLVAVILIAAAITVAVICGIRYYH